MAALLTATKVSKRYGAVQALDSVSLVIDESECVALVGGNGAGKSTLVAIIAGLQVPDAGELVLRGQAVHFRSPKDARAAGIQTVYQTLALCDNLSAAGNLFLGRELSVGAGPFRFVRRRAMLDQTADTLRELGIRITDLGAATANFSGGQRQGLAFARAVGSEPSLLVLDEPTAALGVAERQRVIETVHHLHRDRGIAVLLVTHNLEEMRRLADRVVVLRHGKGVANFPINEADDDTLVGFITGAKR